MFLSASFAAELLAARHRECGYDLSRLSTAERTEVDSLARVARIELPWPGARWQSIAGSNVLAGPVTNADQR